MKILFTLAIGAFLFGAVISSNATVTPIGSSINLTEDANAGVGAVQNQKLVSQTTTLNTLSNSLTVQALNGNLSATAESDGTATWASANAGAFSIHDNFSAGNLSQFASSRVANDGSSWVYSFKSDIAATLTLNYSISYTGPYPYSTILFMNQLAGNSVQSGSLVKQDIFVGDNSVVPPTSGTVQFTLNGGTDYTFVVVDDSNLNQNLPSFNSDMNATFSFQITSVPEPSSLALAGMAALICVFWKRVSKLGLLEKFRS